MNSPDPVTAVQDKRVEAATRQLAEARSRCIQLGLSPQQFAELLLPEALLAMMVAGMEQEQAEAAFERFAREEIKAWYLQVKRTAGYCDCEREAFGEHQAACGRTLSAPLADALLEGAARLRTSGLLPGS